jgi:hypothetical protein
MRTEMWLEMLQRADRSEEGDDIKMDLTKCKHFGGCGFD